MEKWREVIARAGYTDWAEWLLLENAVLDKKNRTLDIAFSNAGRLPDQAKDAIDGAFRFAFRDLQVSVRYVDTEQVTLDK